MKAIATGGGLFHKSEQENLLPIDREALELSGTEKPKVLYVPTANIDFENNQLYIDGYEQSVRREFTERLGCEVEVLHDFDVPSYEELQDKILNTDVIYVGGGDTETMIELWREHGIDSLIEEAIDNGAVLSGLSAGAIAIFKEGFSDSEEYEMKRSKSKRALGKLGIMSWDFKMVEGLGFRGELVNPHHDQAQDGKSRRNKFMQIMKEREEVGVGLENYAALVFNDGKVKVAKGRDGAKVEIFESGNVDYFDAEEFTSDFR